MDNRILIVGAGPVGLTTALSLAKRQIPVRLIDELAAPTNQSRAAIIHARTLEQLERLGVIEPFLETGVRVYGIHVLDESGKSLLRNTLDTLPTTYNYMLGLGQDATERILTDELNAHGVTVERSVTLTALGHDADGVNVVLRHANGREEQARFPYVVGCDGSKSVVRHQLGITLEGDTLDAYWVTADVRMETDYPRDELVGIVSSHGFGFASPIHDGRWRVLADLGEKPEVIPEKVSLEEVQRACDRVGFRAKLSDAVWISSFGINTRMAPTMQSGRVFLCGDAAHVHSPVGGQGMNTGIQDGINLAWKLALMMQGSTTQAMLDSFNEERHANAQRLLRVLGPATRMFELRNPIAVRLRPWAMRAASHAGITGIIINHAGELDVNYRHSAVVEQQYRGTGRWTDDVIQGLPGREFYNCWDFGKGPAPGERATDAAGMRSPSNRSQRLYADWINDGRHQLLLFSGMMPRTDRIQRLVDLKGRIEEEWGELVRPCIVLPKAIEGYDDYLVDLDGEAHHHYGARYECAYLIRPDGYVGFRCQPVQSESIDDYLASHLVRT